MSNIKLLSTEPFTVDTVPAKEILDAVTINMKQMMCFQASKQERPGVFQFDGHQINKIIAALCQLSVLASSTCSVPSRARPAPVSTVRHSQNIARICKSESQSCRTVFCFLQVFMRDEQIAGVFAETHRDNNSRTAAGGRGHKTELNFLRFPA